MMALKPLASPPVVHHETTSTGVCPAAAVGAGVTAAVTAAVGPGVLPAGEGVAELEHAEATRAVTESTARIRRDGSFTDNTSLR